MLTKDHDTGRFNTRERAPSRGNKLSELLSQASELKASDLLLVAGAPPTVFVAGHWKPLGVRRLVGDDIGALLNAALTKSQMEKLSKQCDLDCGLSVPGVGRYRLNVHYQRGSLAAAIRAIPAQIPVFDQLGLPAQVLRFADYSSGLVLVTGCTGQGKSTTLAALIDHLNRIRFAHVVTIEDPIEFIFEHERCVIEQRQIGDDSPSFGAALRNVIRQRPDVIMIGEMRDLETFSTALSAAETGHLVLASLHTASATQTLSRILDIFPPTQQPQIRTQLAGSLRAILCQTLVNDQANESLTPATEILVTTGAIRRAIRENETHLIYSMIETGRSYGMHTMEQSLADLVSDGRVSVEEAFSVAGNVMRLSTLIGYSPPGECQTVASAAPTAADRDPEDTACGSRAHRPVARGGRRDE